MYGVTAAASAKSLLHAAARRLNTADPIGEVGYLIDESLPLPAGDGRYRRSRSFEPTFAESTPGNLGFMVAPGGPTAQAADRVSEATDAARRAVLRNFGPQAERWLAGRAHAASEGEYRSANWGAFVGTGFDRNGMSESSVSYEWGPWLTESLPAPLFQIAQVAMDATPALRPAFSTLRCGRTTGTQQLTFEVESALPLSDLKPLMDRLGLGEKHGGLMSAAALVLGARFTLPPNTAMLTLRPTRAGVEMRLDVNLEALPDPPQALLPLLQLQMAERPRSLRALDRWMTALTPDGFSGPGEVSVLSLVVRPNMAARIAIYLRPALLDAPQQPAEAVPQPAIAAPQPVAAPPVAAQPAQPVAAPQPAVAAAGAHPWSAAVLGGAR
ncbi:MAG TPA: hypothetical protein VF715_11405 [Thermoleophilaceae bacterium]|jgi:hypothetical protein